MVLRLFGVLLASIALVACSSKSKLEEGQVYREQITGTVTYRERMSLGTTAILELSLLDVSLADARAEKLVSAKITNPGPVPISWKLGYDPTWIDENHTYSIRAEIRDRGRLIFTTDRNVQVLTQGNGNTAEITLVRVGSSQF